MRVQKMLAKKIEMKPEKYRPVARLLDYCRLQRKVNYVDPIEPFFTFTKSVNTAITKTKRRYGEMLCVQL